MQFKTETKVGIFVVTAFVLMAYVTVYLGTFRWNLNNYTEYTTHFSDAAGIVPEADVKIAGVKVGWVEGIKLVDGGSRAAVVIKIKDGYQLRSDAIAEVHQDGLLGSKYLELMPGTSKANVVSPGCILENRGRSAASVESLINDLHSVAQKLDNEILPSFQKNMEKISDAFDRDFDKVAKGLDETFTGFKSIVNKVDSGEGLLGKVVNETEIYNDIKVVSQGYREAAEAANNMAVVVDSHIETMGRNAANYNHSEAKGYFGLRLHTSPDWFYLFQIVGSEKGGVTSRKQTHKTYKDSAGTSYSDSDLASLGGAFRVAPAQTDEIVFERDTTRYSYQVGKSFDNIALRFGTFEGFFGIAADYDIPFGTDKVRWVSSLEAFDFRGRERLSDRRPHLKWLNKVFLLRNIYLTFGVDDFVSKNNVNVFYGAGLRFGDDDLKYLLGKFGLGK